MRQKKKERMKNDTHQRYISVETWFHALPKNVDDTGDHRKAKKIMRIIELFCITEVIRCFVVQVWMARVLGEPKKRNEGIERD